MNTIQNRGQIILRTLAIIDVLARSRCGMTRTQIADAITDVCGKRFAENTIRRDLIAMEQLSFVRCEDRVIPVAPWVQPFYTLNQSRTERMQELAISVTDEATSHGR